MLIVKTVRGLRMEASVQPGDIWRLISCRIGFGKWSLKDGLGVEKQNIWLSNHGALSAEWGAPAPVTCPPCSKCLVSLCREEGRKEAGQE